MRGDSDTTVTGRTNSITEINTLATENRLTCRDGLFREYWKTANTIRETGGRKCDIRKNRRKECNKQNELYYDVFPVERIESEKAAEKERAILFVKKQESLVSEASGIEAEKSKLDQK